MFDLDKLLTGAGLDDNKTDNTIKEDNKNSVSVSASPDSIPDAVKEKNSSAADSGPASPDSEKITSKSPKNKKKRKEDNKTDNNDLIINDNKGGDGLPPDFINIIESIINEYMKKYNIDDMQKAAAVQWRSCCQYIGMWAKNSQFYIDKEKSARQGGRVYNAEKIADALEIWAFLCGNFKKVPLITDFIEFVGVSRSWFYDNNGSCELTSASAQILKKASDIQKGGLVSGIVDGRENPTGKIYFSKAVLGWSESGPGRVSDDLPQEKQKNIPDFSTLGLPKL